MYEHVAREYEICERIKNRLVRDNIAEVYVCSLHFEIDNVYKIASKRIIDILVVPYAYKEVSLNKVLLLIKRNRIKVVFNLRHEQIGAGYNEFKLYPRDEFTKKHIYHSAWTEFYLERLIEKGVPPEHVIITQNPRSDLLFERNDNKTSEKNDIAKRFGIDATKKWILLCESGYCRTDEKIDVMIHQGYKVQDLYDYNELVKQDHLSTENQLNNISAGFLNEYEIIYRPHPGKENTLKLSDKVHVITDESIYWWLNSIDVVVSRMSTVLLEAQARGLKVYRFEPNNTPDKFITYGLERLPVISRIEEIAEQKNYIYSNDYEEYLGKVDGHAVDVLVNSFNTILSQDISMYDDIRITYRGIFYSALRAIMSNKLSKFAYNTNWLFLRKFSKSLSVLSRDIPPEWIR